MKRHHYGKSRYDLVKEGCLTVKAKVIEGKFDELVETAKKFAIKVDNMSDYKFNWTNWWYEQNFKCKLGTTEMLVECMLAEKFLHDFWNGVYGKDAHMKEVSIEISTEELTLGCRYDRADWH